MKMRKRIWGLAVAVALLAAPSLVQAKWFWVPSQITNAKAGNAILSADPDGPVGQLLGALGMFFSHTGMFTDAGYHIIHNTGDPSTISLDTYCTAWVCLIPKQLNGTQLRDLKPGVIYQTTEAAFLAKEFHFFDQENNGSQVDRNGVILSPATNAKTFNGQTLDWYLAQAASYFYTNYYGSGASNKQGYYRFYAYTDINSTEPTGRTANKGNMCSGTIYWSLKQVGLPVTAVSYSAASRLQVAPILYNSINSQIQDAGSAAQWADVGLAVLSLGTSVVLEVLGWSATDLVDDLARKGGNQVVNCMAFNDCGNTGTRWQGGVGTGYTVSPDNLTPVGYVNNKGYQWGYQATADGGYNGKGFYGKVSAIQYSGGYWQSY